MTLFEPFSTKRTCEFAEPVVPPINSILLIAVDPLTPLARIALHAPPAADALILVGDAELERKSLENPPVTDTPPTRSNLAYVPAATCTCVRPVDCARVSV